MSEERKLCVHCKWIRYGALGVGEYCGRPDILSEVNGQANKFCSNEREYGRCGPNAKHWEPKPPSFLKNLLKSFGL